MIITHNGTILTNDGVVTNFEENIGLNFIGNMGYSPLDLPSLKLWLDLSDETAVNSKLSYRFPRSPQNGLYSDNVSALALAPKSTIRMNIKGNYYTGGGRVYFGIGDYTSDDYMWIGADRLNYPTAKLVIGGVIQWSFKGNGFMSGWDNWRELTVTHDGVTPKIFFDGTFRAGVFADNLDLTKWISDIPNVNRMSFSGVYVNGALTNYASGNIDEVAIWGRELSNIEVSDVNLTTYEDLTTSQKVGLVTAYPMDSLESYTSPSYDLTQVGTASLVVGRYNTESQDGKGISLVADKSPQSNHAIMEILIRQATYNASGKYAQFDGVDDVLTNASKVSTNKGTLHFVVDMQNLGTYNHIFQDSSGSLTGLLFSGRNGNTFSVASNGADDKLIASALLNTKYLISMQWDAINDTIDTYQDGVFVGSDTFGTQPITVGSNGYRIGSWFDDTGNSNMKLYEVVESDIKDSPTDLANTMNYLKSKHSIV